MKRALSIILALTLAFSLLPTFAAAEDTTGTETETTIDWSQPIVFDFGAPTNPAIVTDGATYGHSNTYKSDSWELVLFRSRSKVLQQTDGTKVKTYNRTGGNYIQISTNDTLTAAGNNIFVIALNVPASGIYNISADVYNSSGGATTKATMLNQQKDVSIEIGEIENVYTKNDDTDPAGKIARAFSQGIGIPVAKTENWDTATNSAGVDNHVVLTITKNGGDQSLFYNFTFTPSNITAASVTVPAAEYEIGAQITPSVSLNVEGVGDKTYSDLDMAGIVLGVKEADAGVTVENNVFTVAKAGEITFTPTVTVNGTTQEAAAITLTVASDEDEALTNAFEVKKEELKEYVAPSVISVSAGGSVITPKKNSDGSYDIEAAEENTDGAKFLYWAKGLKANKKIVSFSNKLESYIPEEDGADWLIAVYDDMLPETKEYYNANGQLLATGEEPALPSMAGYGKADDWKQYGETNIYVAEYSGKTQPDNVEVTVNGEKKTVPYGTEITCTNDAENFKCWTKTNINGKTEIVSIEKVYSFKAWENCEVNAINEAHTYTGDKLKIVIDSFTAGNEIGIMAEFIGFESNVVEKGIMWNDNKISMTKPGSQFSIIADKNGEYKGYAIVGNQTAGYTLITDGSVTISDVEE